MLKHLIMVVLIAAPAFAEKTPIVGRWRGSLTAKFNGCGPEWAGPRDIDLRVIVNRQADGVTEDNTRFFLARAKAPAGRTWKGQFIPPSNRAFGQIDLYTRKVQVDPKTGRALFYRLNLWWNHLPSRPRPLAKMRVDVFTDDSIACSAAYRGRVRRLK